VSRSAGRNKRNGALGKAAFYADGGMNNAEGEHR